MMPHPQVAAAHLNTHHGAGPVRSPVAPQVAVAAAVGAEGGTDGAVRSLGLAPGSMQRSPRARDRKRYVEVPVVTSNGHPGDATAVVEAGDVPPSASGGGGTSFERAMRKLRGFPMDMWLLAAVCAVAR